MQTRRLFVRESRKKPYRRPRLPFEQHDPQCRHLVDPSLLAEPQGIFLDLIDIIAGLFGRRHVDGRSPSLERGFGLRGRRWAGIERADKQSDRDGVGEEGMQRSVPTWLSWICRGRISRQESSECSFPGTISRRQYTLWQIFQGPAVRGAIYDDVHQIAVFFQTLAHGREVVRLWHWHWCHDSQTPECRIQSRGSSDYRISMLLLWSVGCLYMFDISEAVLFLCVALLYASLIG